MYDILSSDILPELIPENSKILVAVSGGPDSVALAHSLWRYAGDNQDKKIILVISHVNHGARTEAHDEARLVQALAAGWGIECIVHKFNAKAYAASCGKGFQEAAREWRYAQWREDMQKYDCTLLATAHHLGDQAETLLYRLIRGTGTAGLAGIYPSSNDIIRPLLSFSKDQIIEYCRMEQLPYALDKSNLEATYDRNKIRLQLMPLLEQYNEKVQQALGRTAELLRWDEEYIRSQVEALWQHYCIENRPGRVLLSHDIWREPQAILSRFLRKAIAIVTAEDRGVEFRFIKTIMREAKKVGWSQDLPGLRIKSLGNGLLFFRGELRQSDITDSLTEYPTVLAETEILLEPGKWYSVSDDYKVGIFKTLPATEQILYCEQLGFPNADVMVPFICRTRQEGDKIYKRGLGHKAIKKVFQDLKIPVCHRKNIPLIAQGHCVIWIPGLLRSDSHLPSDQAQSMFCAFAVQ